MMGDVPPTSRDAAAELEVGLASVRIDSGGGLRFAGDSDVVSSTGTDRNAAQRKQKGAAKSKQQQKRNRAKGMASGGAAEESALGGDTAENSALQLEQQWPVQTRDDAPTRGQHRPTKSPKKLPKQVQRTNSERRKEKVNAKRAERAKLKGFDAHSVNRKLREMVENETDMHAFPPMGDWGLRTTTQMAKCYGLSASTSGGAKKRFIMVRTTPRAQLPSGEAEERLRELLSRSDTTHEEVCIAQQEDVRILKGKKKKKQRPAQPQIVERPEPTGAFAAPIAFIAGGIYSSHFMPETPPSSPRSGARAVAGQEQSGNADSGEVASGGAQGKRDHRDLAAASSPGDEKDGEFLAASGVEEAIAVGVAVLSLSEEAGTRAGEPGLSAQTGVEDENNTDDEEESSEDGEDDSSEGEGEDEENEEGYVGPEVGSEGEEGAGDSEEEEEEEEKRGQFLGLGLRSNADSLFMMYQTTTSATYAVEEEDEEAGGHEQATGNGDDGGSEQHDVPKRAPLPREFAMFERHTRGIGSKLLERMGYRRGSGLGRELQGIPVPLQSEARAGRLGIGAQLFPNEKP